MRLSDMTKNMRGVTVTGGGDPDIALITADSREVVPGALFAALPGRGRDGMDYIEDAAGRGAAALLAPRLPVPVPEMPCVMADDVRRALGEAADAFHGHPSGSLELVGITGTNGKTTCAYLLRHILNRAGRRAGMLGTIEYDTGDQTEPASLTTPDAVRFTRSLARMRDAGCRGAVAEVSSHALAQERVWPHRFACAVFTNLSRDHLDYHGDMASYLEAKRKLFTRLDARAVAVFNYGDRHSARMAEGCAARRTGFILSGGGTDAESVPPGALRAEIAAGDLSGQTFTVRGPGLDGEYRTPLIGRHNAENCLAAILAAAGLGVDRDAVHAALADFPGVPGRLERIHSPSGAMAFVDYSHTDDALRSVLSVLRPLTRGKLITVFGCGGDRDRGKRPLMALAVEKDSDEVLVTSDNPRSECPDAIISDIMSGFVRPGKVTVDPDRRRAIALAVSRAGKGDVILVAGKGHEDYQMLGGERRHFDDREEVRNAFRQVGV